MSEILFARLDEVIASVNTLGLLKANNFSDLANVSTALTNLGFGGSARERLTAARTYYVRSNGSDSNTGLANTSGSAFLTPQKAFDVIMNNIDLNGQAVTVDLTGGAYTSGILFSAMVGTGSVTLLSSVAGSSITTTSNHAIAVSGNAVLTISGTNITLSTITTGVALLAYANGFVSMSGLTFGPSASGHMQAGWTAPNGSKSGGGTIDITGSYAISAGTSGSHLHAVTENSYIHYALSTVTVTLSGTPAFTNFFAGVTKGFIYAVGVTWVGAATGQRYITHNGGVIFGPLSKTELPGNVAGLPASGGLYITDNNINDFAAGTINVGTAVATDSVFTIMANNAQSVAPLAGTNFHIVGADATYNSMVFDTYGGIHLISARRANGTLAAKTGLIANDIILQLAGQGWDTTTYASGNGIQLRSTETWSATAHGGEIALRTVPNATATVTDALVVRNSGGVTIGTAADGGVGSISALDAYTANTNFLLRTKAALTNAAAAAAATLNNAPVAGNPTKWISIDDNGTTRRIPTW